VIGRSIRTFLIAVLTFCLVLQLVIAVAGILSRTPDIGGVEPNVIFVIERVVAGYPLYEDPEEPPFSVTQYSPLYYLLTARIVTMLRIDPREDVWRVYAVARSVSFVAWLLTAVVVYVLCVRVLNLSAFVGFVLAGVTIIVTAINGIAARPDSVARLMIVTGLLCYLASDVSKSKRRKYPLLAAAVSAVVVGIWAKQTAAPMLLIIGILSVVRKRWTDLGSIALLSVGTCLVFYYGLLSSLGGARAIYQNVVRGAFACGIHIEWFGNVLAVFPFMYGALIAMFVATVYVYFAQPGKWSRDVTSLIVSASILLALFSVAAMRYGIWINHAYEAIIFMMLGIATFWTRHAEDSGSSLMSFGSAAAAIAYVALHSLAYTALILYQNHTFVWHPERDWPQVGTQERVVQVLRTELDRYPGSQVFAYWVPYVNLRLFDRAVMPQVELVGACTYRRKTFRYDRFVEGVKSREIRFLVARRALIPESYAGADLTTFETITQIGDYVIRAQR
jgi:hypothetical protein